MPGGEDLRLLFKQERSLKISLDNLKEFICSHPDGADRRGVELRLCKLDEICSKFIDVQMRIELHTDDVADGDISTDTEETEEAKLQRHMRL